ncbi:MAG: peptidoglycan DD-metalloendopeptidase family protein [Betaproteobacteria bacterium]|nr:peptidoglycan DD-metalloendopeptidase family protein [Betaproteobacteria bacterium]
MKVRLQRFRGVLAAGLALLLAYGCASTPRQAPVIERKPAVARPAVKPSPPAEREADSRPDYYTVRKGDTLYTIALDHGLDYRELVEWNNITNPNVIRVGQRLRLKAPVSSAVATPLKSAPEVTPLKTAPEVGGTPVGSAPPVASGDAVKSQPKAVKVPYSDQALAQLSGAQAKPAETVVARLEPRPAEKPAASEEDEEKVDWGWPAGGKLLSAFNESTNLKGIGIAGKPGQPVIASAPGKVLYSGDGIRGYGKLVIIKHNKAYLSVYAHNSQLLVKEGQSVVKGQRIAEMGNTDSAQIKLHFEIRRFGKPVDPIKLLPPEPPA